MKKHFLLLWWFMKPATMKAHSKQGPCVLVGVLMLALSGAARADDGTLRLDIALSGEDLVIAWPAEYAHYQLQYRPDLLNLPPWASVTNAVMVANDWRQVVVQPTGQSGFYRLAQLTWPIPFSDSDTVALWLFDETDYPFTTLIDASEYQYDLSLMPGGHLVAGKYGQALSVTAGTTNHVMYSGFSGSAAHDNMGVRGSGQYVPLLWGPTVAPEQILNAFTQSWTCEFWLKLDSVPGSEVAILSLGHAFNPGVAFNLTAGAASFNLSNCYAGFAAVCPTASGSLTDGQWHHVAFTRAAADGQVKHYLDGQVQSTGTVSSIASEPLPAVVWPSDLSSDTFGWTASSPTIAGRQAGRFNVELGQDRNGNLGLNGLIDEVRISKVIRYTNNFTPGTFSRNYAPGATGPAVANGLPLLFTTGSPLQLGGRKHVLVDTNLFESTTNVTLTMNPATGAEALNTRMTGQATVYDINGRIYMLIGNGYSSAQGNVWVRYSDDGLNFTAPNWGLYGDDRVLTLQPMYGTVFEDLNPTVAPNERFKLTAWSSNRGICLYLSADGIYWRRNETMMLPLASGGDAESYWDDQRGYYRGFLKRDSSYNNISTGCTGSGRRGTGFKTTEILKTWPFTVQSPPYYEDWTFPANTCEGPVVFPVTAAGQVYRTRAQKYPWAPDTYLAFIWRDGNDNTIVDLGTSRDGDTWRCFATSSSSGPWYNMGRGASGMIKRGDEIWQYMDNGTTSYRIKQRLDGFTSVNAGGTSGVAVSKPLVFSGNKLVLNLNATGGTARVGILDAAGNPISGFTVSDCDAITANSTSNTVTWSGGSSVSGLAGTTVKLQFEMTNTKLYAMQFVKE